MNKIRVGIDPGKDGFVTVLYSDNTMDHFSMPLIGTELDIGILNQIICAFSDNDSIHVTLESVHAIFGSSAKATFNFGFVVGVIQALLIANKIPFTLVQPKKWQKEMWEGIPIQKKESSTGKTQVTDTKKMSLLAVKRLFPEVDLRKSERAKKPHDGKVDSILLAEYGRRNF